MATASAPAATASATGAKTGAGFCYTASRAATQGAAALGRALGSKRAPDSQHPETPGGKKVGAAAAGKGVRLPLVFQSFSTPGGPAGPSQEPQPQVAQPFDFKVLCGRCGLGNCQPLSIPSARRTPVHRTVAASAAHGCSLCHARLQPLPRTVAASATHGCSLCHARLLSIPSARRPPAHRTQVPASPPNLPPNLLLRHAGSKKPVSVPEAQLYALLLLRFAMDEAPWVAERAARRAGTRTDGLCTAVAPVLQEPEVSC